ncbi:helicase C-terminal domain-containing protein [Lipomyces orientalis]|uniref:Helicase C-terminal domain-containing protein n=1 Tax=Lipomyces orientalis TaxID=1233043 RepID=A0ACC3U051_9ASCO
MALKQSLHAHQQELQMVIDSPQKTGIMSEKEIDSPYRDFNHPYTPYKIQLDFMNALYDTIEEGKIGIFESPTGTGKSLSLICGAMKWLRDHQSISQLNPPQSADQDDSEPAWVREYHENMVKEKRLRKYKELEARIRRVREIEQREKANAQTKNWFGLQDENRRKRANASDKNQDDGSRFIVDDWDSGSEDVKSSKKDSSNKEYNNISSEVQELLKRLSGQTEDNSMDEELEDFDEEVKIFYASRTHSQLTQFVQQLRLPTYPPSELYQSESSLRHVPLSSRKQLCIHPTVSRLRDLNTINDKCTELQQNPTDRRCPYLMNEREVDDRVKTRDFRDRVLSDIRDIEDMSEIGSSMGVCPYYASRGAIELSEVVTLPYPLLLQSSYRKALSISLKNQIVIIDEAHNLLDAITSLFSMAISYSDIVKSKRCVEAYLAKFSKRLNGGNKVYISQIIKLLNVLELFLVGFKGSNGTEVSQNDVLLKDGVDTINIFKIENYVEKSKLARKVESYATQSIESAAVDDKENKNRARKLTASVPVLSKIISFLMALTNPSNEGKVFFEQTNADRFLKYLLLDPSFHFRSIVEEARCVILAGGTMEPVSDYMRYLLPYVPSERIRTLSCDHVIPRENLGVWTIATGPTGADLTFTFDRQRVDSIGQELGRTIANLTFVIPDGMVVFFPSYKYMEEVSQCWKKVPNGSMSIWDQINQRKTIFQEPRDSAQVESILSAYAQALSDKLGQQQQQQHRKAGGAILLAVVGGKMSEGINFSDHLARGIVMVGLPFPNARSADMVAKRRYVENTAYDETKRRELALLQEQYAGETAIPPSEMIGIDDSCKKAGEKASREYYENVCMRSVNQSIGRGIRHAKDYAVILFVDSRFGQERIQSKLPKWIRSRMTNGNSEDTKIACVLRSVREFFKEKN